MENLCHYAIYIERIRSLESIIKGGVHGGAATVANVIVSIPHLLNEKRCLVRPINMSMNLI